MASVVISGDTSGSATIQAQAIAGNTVLTLPTTSGTILAPTGGTLTASQGGTGITSAGSAGNVLTSDGATWTSATPSPTMFMLSAEANATASRTIFITVGTWQVTLQDAGGYADGSNHNFTVTRNGTVSSTTVTTSYQLYKSGGAGFGRYVYGIDNAVGTLVVAADATVTMSIAAPVVSGSGSPSTYAGAMLFLSKIS